MGDVVQVSPKAFAAETKEQEAGEISLQGTAIEKPDEGTPSMSELKHIYYNQMIRFHKQTNNYLEIVRALLAIYADFKTEPEKWQPVFRKVVWCGPPCPLSCCTAFLLSTGVPGWIIICWDYVMWFRLSVYVPLSLLNTDRELPFCNILLPPAYSVLLNVF
jgi:hypothetical protein